MSIFGLRDGEEIIPQLHGDNPISLNCQGKSIHLFNGSNFPSSKSVIGKYSLVRVLPTIPEEDKYRDLEDENVAVDPSDYPELPVAECKKNHPLRFSRKPKRRLPFPIPRSLEPSDVPDEPWMYEAEDENISYLVPEELAELSEKNRPNYVRWHESPIITQDEIDEWNKNNDEMDVKDIISGRWEIDVTDPPRLPKRKPLMNFDMLLNYYDKVDSENEVLIKFTETLYDPHKPWYKQKHLSRRNKSILIRNLLIENEVMHERAPKKIVENAAQWTPWKNTKGMPRGRGRRGYIRGYYPRSGFSRDGQAQTEEAGGFSGRRGYRGFGRGNWGDRGGRGSWGSGNAGAVEGGWGSGDMEFRGRGGRGSWGSRDAFSRAGGWGSGDVGFRGRGGQSSWGSGAGRGTFDSDEQRKDTWVSGDTESRRGTSSWGGGGGWGSWGQARGDWRGGRRGRGTGFFAGRGGGRGWGSGSRYGEGDKLEDWAD